MSKISKTIFLISDIVLFIILSLALYFATPLQIPKQLYIPKGSIRTIITNLQERYHIAMTPLDSYLLRFFGTPQSGWIDLSKSNLTRADFLYQLTRAKAALIKIKMIPGETTYNILKAFSKRFHTPLKMLQNEYNKVAPFADGVFFADTYYLPKGMNPLKMVDLLVLQSLQRHKRLSRKIFGSYNEYLWFTKTVTIASIIQKEAANKAEMPLVSAVIYNRLKAKMPLQMDGTLNYGAYSHIKVTHRRIMEDKSPFNTYRFRGLPPYPVCIVGLTAIKAAISPAKVDYLYFVRGKNGRHIFSKSYKAHLRNIEYVKNRNTKVKK